MKQIPRPGKATIETEPTKKTWDCSNRSVIQISDEVLLAVRKRKPIVALETTIYTHGFPYPENLALALDLEKIVRKNGAIPATIGILNGVAKIGLTAQEIYELASCAGKPETMKVSRRDLPFILGMVSFVTLEFLIRHLTISRVWLVKR